MTQQVYWNAPQKRAAKSVKLWPCRNVRKSIKLAEPQAKANSSETWEEVLAEAYAAHPKTIGLLTLEISRLNRLRVFWVDSISGERGEIGSCDGGDRPGAERYRFIPKVLAELKRLRSAGKTKKRRVA